jgi:hypothetical protein
LHPLGRWYASDGVQLIEGVGEIANPNPGACADQVASQRASRRVVDFVRGAALVVAVRRRRA